MLKRRSFFVMLLSPLATLLAGCIGPRRRRVPQHVEEPSPQPLRYDSYYILTTDDGEQYLKRNNGDLIKLPRNNKS